MTSTWTRREHRDGAKVPITYITEEGGMQKVGVCQLFLSAYCQSLGASKKFQSFSAASNHGANSSYCSNTEINVVVIQFQHGAMLKISWDQAVHSRYISSVRATYIPTPRTRAAACCLYSFWWVCDSRSLHFNRHNEVQALPRCPCLRLVHSGGYLAIDRSILTVLEYTCFEYISC